MTLRVKVPPQAVGHLIGKRGSIIKDIQTETNTTIVSPTRGNDTIFFVTGLPENVKMVSQIFESRVNRRVFSNSLAENKLIAEKSITMGKF